MFLRRRTGPIGKLNKKIRGYKRCFVWVYNSKSGKAAQHNLFRDCFEYKSANLYAPFLFSVSNSDISDRKDISEKIMDQISDRLFLSNIVLNLRQEETIAPFKIIDNDPLLYSCFFPHSIHIACPQSIELLDIEENKKVLPEGVIEIKQRGSHPETGFSTSMLVDTPDPFLINQHAFLYLISKGCAVCDVSWCGLNYITSVGDSVGHKDFLKEVRKRANRMDNPVDLTTPYKLEAVDIYLPKKRDQILDVCEEHLRWVVKDDDLANYLIARIYMPGPGLIPDLNRFLAAFTKVNGAYKAHAEQLVSFAVLDNA